MNESRAAKAQWSIARRTENLVLSRGLCHETVPGCVSQHECGRGQAFECSAHASRWPVRASSVTSLTMDPNKIAGQVESCFTHSAPYALASRQDCSDPQEPGPLEGADSVISREAPAALSPIWGVSRGS
jgi:hypothetical protein